MKKLNLGWCSVILEKVQILISISELKKQTNWNRIEN